MSFFLFLLQSITILTARVEWINDWIKVPLHEPIESYRYLPEARIYVNDLIVIGAKVTYERNGVEWTFISTVNTSHVRTYGIRYRAYFPDYNITSTHTITFDVVDVIPPEFVDIPEKTMIIGDKLPNLKEGVVVKDNYYSDQKLIITMDTSLVVITRVGDYPITYRVFDPSGNETAKTVILKIIDPLPPLITLTKPLIIEVSQPFVWQNFMTIKDNVDTIIVVEIDDKNVHYHQIGNYELVIKATDRSGNQTIETLVLDIRDTTKPTITLKSKPPGITVYESITRTLLESYVISISDNYDHLSFTDLVIVHDIEENVLGIYSIYYELSDLSGNKTTVKLNVHVIDPIKPTITLTKALIFDVFSVEPFWIDHFSFSDNFTPTDKLTYKFTVSPKMNVIGKYPLTLEVVDSSLNKAIYQDYVVIIDRIPPIITQMNDIIITDFKGKDYRYFFEFYDEYDKLNVTFFVDDSDVNYDVIGTYQAVAFVHDKQMNQTSIIFDIMIIDIVDPHLSLRVTVYQHAIDHTPIDLSSLIVSVDDNYDYLSIEDVFIEHNIIWTRCGRYEAIYTLYDHSNNKVQKTVIITIDDYIKPTIIFDDTVILQGAPFDPYEGVVASDNVGVDTIYVFPKNPLTDKPGTMIVTYIVMDERGNYTMHDRRITILPTEQKNDIQTYIPIVVITFIGLVLGYIVYKRG